LRKSPIGVEASSDGHYLPPYAYTSDSVSSSVCKMFVVAFYFCTLPCLLILISSVSGSHAFLYFLVFSRGFKSKNVAFTLTSYLF